MKSRWTFNVCSVLLILNHLIDYMQCDIVLQLVIVWMHHCNLHESRVVLTQGFFDLLVLSLLAHKTLQ